MSEGMVPRPRAQSDAWMRHQLEVTPMFKKILLSAVALSGLVLGVSQAEAGYGYGYGGYGYHYRPHYRYSYSYCH